MPETPDDRASQIIRLRRDAVEQTYALYESARVNLSRIKQERTKSAPTDDILSKARSLELSLFYIYMKAVDDLNHFSKYGKLKPKPDDIYWSFAEIL
jgi:hypothetical protein